MIELEPVGVLLSNIRAAMKERRMTLEALGAEMGVDAGQLSKILNEKNNLTMDLNKFRRACLALHEVPVDLMPDSWKGEGREAVIYGMVEAVIGAYLLVSRQYGREFANEKQIVKTVKMLVREYGTQGITAKEAEIALKSGFADLINEKNNYN